MRFYLYVRQVIFISCFLVLSLAACAPEPETAVSATAPPAEASSSSPIVVSTSLPFPTATNPPTAMPTLTPDPFQESATASQQTITVTAAAVTATASPSPESRRCEQPFADVNTATENVINKGPKHIEISLVAPEPGAYIRGGHPEQLFSWTYGGLLPDNWHFEIRFYKAAEPGFQAPFGWMKETSRTINLNNLSSGGEYEWNVVIIQGVDGSVESEIYHSPRCHLQWEG